MSQFADNEYLFTSESVTEGHPDKVADQISDGVLDAVLAEDPYGRVACETLVNTGLVVVSGEITTSAVLDIQEIARETIRKIGYVDARPRLQRRLVRGAQRDRQAVAGHRPGRRPALEARTGASDEAAAVAGAGDQGMMFGYATNETPELMPVPISLAHRLAERLAAVRKDGTLGYLRPDGKTQVSVRYRDGKPVGVEKLLISTQHARRPAPGADPRATCGSTSSCRRSRPTCTTPTRCAASSWSTRPAGSSSAARSATRASPAARSSSTPTAASPATAAARSPARTRRRSTAPPPTPRAGSPRTSSRPAWPTVPRSRSPTRSASRSPVSVMVETFGTEKIGRGRIAQLIDEHFDLRPGAFREELKLHRPIFQKTAAYGHFGRDDPDFTWESTDKADALREAAGLAEAVTA